MIPRTHLAAACALVACVDRAPASSWIPAGPDARSRGIAGYVEARDAESIALTLVDARRVRIGFVRLARRGVDHAVAELTSGGSPALELTTTRSSWFAGSGSVAVACTSSTGAWACTGAAPEQLPLLVAVLADLAIHGTHPQRDPDGTIVSRNCGRECTACVACTAGACPAVCGPCLGCVREAE